MANKKTLDPLDSLIQPIETNDTNIETEHLKEMFKMIYSKDDIEVKTDLTPPQVLAVTKLGIYGTTFGIQIVNDIARTFMELSVSKNRLGRKEFTEISKAAQQQQVDDSKTISERLFGGSRK